MSKLVPNRLRYFRAYMRWTRERRLAGEKVPTPGDSTETWRRWRERFEASREACATCGGTGEVTRADS